MTMVKIVKPPEIAALPVNKAGYVIPWFVDRDADLPDGEPDFRIADSRKMRDAIRFELCWVCGKRRGQFGSFVVGPMCAINRTSSEPPCHLACAVYSARACPFLTTPRMTRRERHMPEDHISPAGVMLKRNPGVTLVYTSRTFKPFRVSNGLLWDMGTAVSTAWFAEGRAAHLVEVLASIESGIGSLAEVASEEGPEAVAELEHRRAELEESLRRQYATEGTS
jgi:hypothetical protein